MEALNVKNTLGLTRNIGNGPKAKTDKPPMPNELDCIASLLVSHKRQVVAVGVRASADKLAFTLASNDGYVSDKTRDHAEMMLRELQRLGHKYSRNRKEYQNPQEEEEEEEEEEGALDDFQKALRDELDSLKIRIYRFSLPKLRRRLQRTYLSIQCVNLFLDSVKQLPDDAKDPAGLVKILRRICMFLELVRTHVEEHKRDFDQTPDEVVWIIVTGMQMIRRSVDELFGIDQWYPKLLRLPMGTEVVFPYEKFLTSLIALPSSINFLLRSTFSRFFYRSFLKYTTISVDRIPSSNIEAGKKPGTAVHCECLLALELTRKQRMDISNTTSCNNAIPAVRHISVSDPACLSCAQFLKTLYQQSHIRFRVRHTESADLDWKFPVEAVARAGLSCEAQAGIMRAYTTRPWGAYDGSRFKKRRVEKSERENGGGGNDVGRNISQGTSLFLEILNVRGNEC